MTPRVTLLRPEGSTFSFIFGKKSFDFIGRKPRGVPVAVALQLEKMRKQSGELLFKVERLPEIITAPSEQGEEPEVTAPRQLLFKAWALSAV